MKRRWIWIVAVVAALLLGIGIGSASQKSEIDKLTKQRDEAVSTLHDRGTLRLENEAKAAAEKADKERAQREAAKKAADEQAQQQAAQKAAMEDAVRKAAAMSTIDSDGVYAIGADKNPGRYHTDGGTSCYWAVLNSPDTQDIATNDLISGPAYADLPAGKYFDTKDCGTWTKVG